MPPASSPTSGRGPPLQEAGRGPRELEGGGMAAGPTGFFPVALSPRSTGCSPPPRRQGWPRGQASEAPNIFLSYLSPIHYNSLTYETGQKVSLPPQDVLDLPELSTAQGGPPSPSPCPLAREKEWGTRFLVPMGPSFGTPPRRVPSGRALRTAPPPAPRG